MKKIKKIEQDISYPEKSQGIPSNKDFLISSNATPKEQLNEIENCTGEEKILSGLQIGGDIKSLTKSDLSKKYYLEYKRWGNMKQRRKKGYVISPRFEKFIDFLECMGAIPNKYYTLDRIDNNNKTYSPENCRWADKYTQNSNKGNNVYIVHNGETKTIAQWAKITNQNPSTLYMRKKNGWSDDEIVTGDKEHSSNNPWDSTPWPIGKELAWERKYHKAVIDGKNIDRLEFFYATAKMMLGRAREKLINFDDSKEQGEIDKELDKIKIELNRWERLFNNAQKKSKYQRSRKLFIERKGSLGKYKEAVLFDLVHGENLYNERPI